MIGQIVRKIKDILKQKSPGSYGVGLFMLIVLLGFSLSLRHPKSPGAVGAENLEASHHVLLTVKALEESSVNRHFYLPIVTLGLEGDQKIAWGATIPTAAGDYIYTSFTPAGFLAPYAALRLFGAPPTLKNLAKFNFALGVISSVFLFVLLYQISIFIGSSPLVATGAALVGSSIGVFSKEVLQSHGLVYWSHCLYQVILILSLLFVFRYLKTRGQYGFAIVALAFLGAWTEWTGYIFNVGIAVLFWFGIGEVGRSRRLSAQILFATLCAGVLTLVHYSLVLGFEPTVEAFVGRFWVRSASTGSLVQLLQGYGLSFGFFLVILVGLAIAGSFSSDGPLRDPEREKAIKFVFIAACVPLLENVFMMQHASQFSFDRLKFIFPAAICFALYFSRKSNGYRVVLVSALALASVHGSRSYQEDLLRYQKWNSIDSENTEIAQNVLQRVDKNCAVFLTNVNVRGYSNLLIGRGIYENRKLDEAKGLMDERHACAAVFLDGDVIYSDFSKSTRSVFLYPDLPQFKKAIILYPDGSGLEVTAKAVTSIDNAVRR